jgi:hypothetical protein
MIGCLAVFLSMAEGAPCLAQSVLSGNAAVSELVGRTNITSYKATLKALSDFGPRQIINQTQTQSNIDAIAWAVGKWQTLGYEVTVYGAYKNVYCTKIGIQAPDSMYMVGAHLDGMSGGSCDDNASGCALVMEMARVFSDPNVSTRYSIRFILFNQEEGGYLGSKEYADTRRSLQGKESPAGSGKYPEPRWLGLINQDMILYDHGVPFQPQQALDANLAANYCSFCDPRGSLELANAVINVKQIVAVDYPCSLGTEMRGDEINFMNDCPVVLVREGIDNHYNPTHHDDSDVYNTFSEADFALGYSGVRRVMGAIASYAKAMVTIAGTSTRGARSRGLTAVAASDGSIRLYDASGRAFPVCKRANPRGSVGGVSSKHEAFGFPGLFFPEEKNR